MAKRSFTYRFWVSATNEGYGRSLRPRYRHYITQEIIYTFSQEVEKFVECNNGTFVIDKEDVRFRKSTPLKNSKDVLCYLLRNNVRYYLDYCEIDNQDTCIIEYELLREDKFSTNQYISDKFRQEVELMVNAIYAIEKNPLINHNKELAAMNFEVSLNYVSSEIFSILKKRATSDSPNKARTYLKDFIAAFFRLIPKAVIEKYDTLYEKREAVRIKNAGRDKESGAIRCCISPDERESYGGKALAIVSRLIRKDLKQKIDYIIHCVYNGQKFCFESFASWKKTIIAFLNIDGKSIKYVDSNTPSAILNEISDEQYKDDVEKFLYYIDKQYNIRNKHKAQASAIFYKFLKLCPSKYLNDKYKRRIGNVDKEFKRKEFKDLCLQYFGLEANSIKPKDLVKVPNIEFNSDKDNENVWDRIK